MSGAWTVRLEGERDIPADFLELMLECKQAGNGISVRGLTLEASGRDQVEYLVGLARLVPGLRLVVRQAGMVDPGSRRAAVPEGWRIGCA
ncbi:MAG: hypothetical protein QME93_11260 [Bacillota bacterium]|nr:hypothetical protein [Bacillota bacterium]